MDTQSIERLIPARSECTKGYTAYWVCLKGYTDQPLVGEAVVSYYLHGKLIPTNVVLSW